MHPMTPRIAELVRQLVEELAREDGVLPEPGRRRMLEWQLSGSAEFQVSANGRVSIPASCVQATIGPVEMEDCGGCDEVFQS